jgi:hypothetical protein
MIRMIHYLKILEEEAKKKKKKRKENRAIWPMGLLLLRDVSPRSAVIKMA